MKKLIQPQVKNYFIANTVIKALVVTIAVQAIKKSILVNNHVFSALKFLTLFFLALYDHRFSTVSAWTMQTQ